MELPFDILRYFLYSSGATVCGVLYWISVQNLGERHYKLVYVGLLTIFLSPFGAWAVTALVRMGDLSKKLKEGKP